MKFFIITPSFNQLDYLKRCIASVRDQAAPVVQRADNSTSGSESSIHVHHHIQDGGSFDGTVEWLGRYAQEIGDQRAEVSAPNAQCPVPSAYAFTYESAPDDGMYDALNKGVEQVLRGQRTEDGGRKAEDKGPTAEEGGRRSEDCPDNQLPSTNSPRDSVFAWLNCDEQYLPGTLDKVARYFREHPGIDFVYGSTLLVDAEGKLISCRKNPPLRKMYVESDHLYTQSASMFFRTNIFEQGLRFDTTWKAVSDCDFVLQLLNFGFKSGRMDTYLSTFTMTGDNLSANDIGWSELEKWRSKASRLIRSLSLLFRGCRFLEKLVSGGFFQKFPLDYALYAGDDLKIRTCFRANSGTTRFVSWKR
ncbi:hypothetical protein P4B35_15515 [Pontiellaceae bacterium B12227]|nr:hypothetical protein [Pontiellaceae bacterium B12227]